MKNIIETNRLRLETLLLPFMAELDFNIDALLPNLTNGVTYGGNEGAAFILGPIEPKTFIFDNSSDKSGEYIIRIPIKILDVLDKSDVQVLAKTLPTLGLALVEFQKHTGKLFNIFWRNPVNKDSNFVRFSEEAEVFEVRFYVDLPNCKRKPDIFKNVIY